MTKKTPARLNFPKKFLAALTLSVASDAFCALFHMDILALSASLKMQMKPCQTLCYTYPTSTTRTRSGVTTEFRVGQRVRFNTGVVERTGTISRIWEWPDHPALSDCEIEGWDGIVALHDIEHIVSDPKNT